MDNSKFEKLTDIKRRFQFFIDELQNTKNKFPLVKN